MCGLTKPWVKTRGRSVRTRVTSGRPHMVTTRRNPGVDVHRAWCRVVIKHWVARINCRASTVAKHRPRPRGSRRDRRPKSALWARASSSVRRQTVATSARADSNPEAEKVRASQAANVASKTSQASATSARRQEKRLCTAAFFLAEFMLNQCCQFGEAGLVCLSDGVHELSEHGWAKVGDEAI